MKKIVISKKCNACGMCTAMSELFISDEKGFARANNGGFFDEKDMDSVKEVVLTCPTDAITIEDADIGAKAGKAGLTELKATLKKKLESIVKPEVTIKDIKFDANNYSVDLGYYENSSGYDYKSDAAAERAGLREFDRVAYSQYRKIILSVFVQYKNDKLKPYYTFDETGFYGKNNKFYSDVLKEIANQARIISNNAIKLPNDFEQFKVLPGDDFHSSSGNDDCVYHLKNFENNSTSSGIMADFNSESYHSKDAYITYFDTDSHDVYLGEGWLGSKYDSTYRYYNLRGAVDEYVKDLKGSMNYVDIDENAYFHLKGAIESYYKCIDKKIEKKLQEFEEAISMLK